MNYTQRPGETPAFAGIYQEIETGGRIPNPPRFCTIEPGDSVLPPTSHAGNLWLWITPYIPRRNK